MKPRNLLVAAIVLAALSGLVWWSKKHPPSATPVSPVAPTPKLADVSQADVTAIDLQKKDGPELTLSRQNNKWAITAPEALPADQDAASSLASTLNPLNADNVVEDHGADLAKYGLSAPSLKVTVHERNGKSAVIDFGDDVPAGSLVYARLNSQSKVYAVSSTTKTSLDKTANDLRDKRLLTFDSNHLTRIEVSSPKGGIEFAKNNQNDWQIVKPQSYRADNFQVEELLRKLTDAKMDFSGTADTGAKAQTAFAGGQPVATAKLTDAAGTQTLDIRKNKDDYYAKSSVVPGLYKVSTDLGKQVEKPLEEYRNKKIYDFGFNDPTKIDVQQGSSSKMYVRAGSDWKLDGKTVDPGSIQGFIDKLRDLTAAKFVSTGFASPALAITVTSNDGKRIEKAEFSKNSDGYIGRREAEPALYQLDSKSVNDILEAANAVKPSASKK